ncbi:hypothetical protein EDD86DRAFT_244068 [Gorgonomyces haynaldii]|nr:hypothetical protein EDD86DRAFT_244068 [Gorgonomyces haynaldii]
MTIDISKLTISSVQFDLSKNKVAQFSQMDPPSQIQPLPQSKPTKSILKQEKQQHSVSEDDIRKQVKIDHEDIILAVSRLEKSERRTAIANYVRLNAQDKEEAARLTTYIVQQLKKQETPSESETSASEPKESPQTVSPGSSVNSTIGALDTFKIRKDSKLDLDKELNGSDSSVSFPRCDFFQTAQYACLEIYCKNLHEDDVHVDLDDDFVSLVLQQETERIMIAVPLEYPIVQDKSDMEITNSKISIKLFKAQPQEWSRPSPKFELLDEDMDVSESSGTVYSAPIKSPVPRSMSAPPSHVSQLYSKPLTPVLQQHLNLALLRDCRSASPPLHNRTFTTPELECAPESRMQVRCGLYNEGVDCFINTVIQCLASEPKLVEYFLDNKYLEHINTDNPLSNSKGEMAHVFCRLLQQLFSSKKPFTPSKFKQALQMYWPIYDPWQQQDAQEFLNYLLDALHEDVNKVTKKPYIELPDFDDTSDDKETSQVFWDAHIKRNDSIIVDLFQGQYKSLVTCLTCKKTSVKFDPFMNLTMELPIVKQEFKITLVDLSNQKFNFSYYMNAGSTYGDFMKRLREDHPEFKGDFVAVAVDPRQRKVVTNLSMNDPMGSGQSPIAFVYEYEPNNTYLFINHVIDTEYGYPDYFGIPQMMSLPPGNYHDELIKFINAKLISRKIIHNVTSAEPVFEMEMNPPPIEGKYVLGQSKIAMCTLHWTHENKQEYFNEEVDCEFKAGETSSEQESVNLEQCFQEHLKQEEMDEVYCRECKSHQKSSKKLDLWKLPQVLVIHLKRFIQNPRTGNWTKQAVPVSYPIQDAPFGQYSINPETKDLKHCHTSNGYLLFYRMKQ